VTNLIHKEKYDLPVILLVSCPYHNATSMLTNKMLGVMFTK